MEALPQDLADFLVTKNFDPEYFDKAGQPCEAGDAKTMKFDYVSDTGKNYGTAVCVIADDELSLFYGDNLGRGMEPDDKDEWFTFLEELSNKAASHSAIWSPRDINQLKHTLAGIAAIKEGLFEGYYGSRRVSYMGEQTQARLVINHNRVLGEDDKRYRYVESLFIETADQERFRLPFKSLAGGRAMLEHVRQGGRPYDIRGAHIAEIVSEMAVLGRFNRAQQRRVFEGVTQQLVESAKEYYHNLQETMKHLGSSRGYQAYFEGWAPDHVGEEESLVENLRNLFVEQTLDARIEAALPTLAKIQQQGTKMKEAQIFENWINNLSEGTWALPETPEQMEKLNQLMSGELIVGPDATNATEQLYDLVGDDELFDILNDLADRSEGRANCWDDSDVQRRLAELGIQTPQSTQAEPADVGQDTAPEIKEGEEADSPKYSMSNPGKLSNQEYKDQMNRRYGEPDMDTSRMNKAHQDFYDKNPSFKQGGREVVSPGDGRLASKVVPAVTDTKVDRIPMNTPGGGKQSSSVPNFLRGAGGRAAGGSGFGGVKPGQSPSLDTPIQNENAELARMLKHAGVPLKESTINDDTGNTWDHLLNRFRHEVENFKQTGDMSDDLYDALYDYYNHHGAMPYGVAKARDGDPYEWIGNRLARDLGLEENLITPMIMPVSEGSCNMTAEGSYCPEHGLAECGMYEQFLSEPIASKPDPKPDVNFVTSPPVPPKFTNQTATGKVDYSIAPKLTNAQGLGNKLDMDEDGGAVGMPYSMHEGVYDPDYRGNYNNEFDELEDLMGKSAFSHEEALRKRFLSQKYGLNTPADMTKLPALRKDAEAGYKTRKAEIDADLEKRNQQHLQDKLTDLQYAADPIGFLKQRAGIAPAPATADAPTRAPAPATAPAPTPATADAPTSSTNILAPDYSLPRAKLGSSPSVKLPNFRPEPSTEVPATSTDSAPAQTDQTDSRNQKGSIFQQLAQLQRKTRGNMAEGTTDDPINSNSAMTGAYYEGKETKSQEGDALLARIKSLALLR